MVCDLELVTPHFGPVFPAILRCQDPRIPRFSAVILRFKANTVHLTFLDANSHVHDARAEAPTRPEWKLAHLTLHPPGHTAPATRYDPIPGVRQQGLMEGWPVPRGE